MFNLQLSTSSQYCYFEGFRFTIQVEGETKLLEDETQKYKGFDLTPYWTPIYLEGSYDDEYENFDNSKMKYLYQSM